MSEESSSGGSKTQQTTIVFINGFLTPTNWISYPSHVVPDDIHIISVSPSPTCSLHDRVMQIFYELKGGLVDYGERHSRFHGHARYGRYNAKAKYPQWDEDHPVILMGHSLGGVTAYVLHNYLATNRFASHQTSADWVSAVICINSPLNGAMRVYDQGMDLCHPPTVRWGSTGCWIGWIAQWTEFFGNEYMKTFMDCQQEHWRMRFKDSGSLYRLVLSLFGVCLHSSTDNIAYDASVHAAVEWAKFLRTFPDTFYFSIAGNLADSQLTVPHDVDAQRRLAAATSGEDDMNARYKINLPQIYRSIIQLVRNSEVVPFIAGVDTSTWPASGTDGLLSVFTQEYPRIAETLISEGTATAYDGEESSNSLDQCSSPVSPYGLGMHRSFSGSLSVYESDSDEDFKLVGNKNLSYADESARSSGYAVGYSYASDLAQSSAPLLDSSKEENGRLTMETSEQRNLKVGRNNRNIVPIPIHQTNFIPTTHQTSLPKSTSAIESVFSDLDRDLPLGVWNYTHRNISHLNASFCCVETWKFLLEEVVPTCQRSIKKHNESKILHQPSVISSNNSVNKQFNRLRPDMQSVHFHMPCNHSSLGFAHRWSNLVLAIVALLILHCYEQSAVHTEDLLLSVVIGSISFFSAIAHLGSFIVRSGSYSSNHTALLTDGVESFFAICRLCALLKMLNPVGQEQHHLFIPFTSSRSLLLEAAALYLLPRPWVDYDAPHGKLLFGAFFCLFPLQWDDVKYSVIVPFSIMTILPKVNWLLIYLLHDKKLSGTPAYGPLVLYLFCIFFILLGASLIHLQLVISASIWSIWSSRVISIDAWYYFLSAILSTDVHLTSLMHRIIYCTLVLLMLFPKWQEASLTLQFYTITMHYSKTAPNIL